MTGLVSLISHCHIFSSPVRQRRFRLSVSCYVDCGVKWAIIRTSKLREMHAASGGARGIILPV